MSTVNGFQVGNDVLKYNYESLENYNTPDFSPSSTYSVGDYVIYQGKLYKCITAITTAGAWNSANWQLAVLSNDVKTVKGDIANNYDASSTYAVGDYVLYNDQLYICNTEISTAEVWTSAHWTLATMGDDVSNLKNQIDVLMPTILHLKDKIYTSANGGISSSTHEHYNSNNYRRTVPIFLKSGYTIAGFLATSTGFLTIAAYTSTIISSENYIAGVNGLTTDIVNYYKYKATQDCYVILSTYNAKLVDSCAFILQDNNDGEIINSALVEKFGLTVFRDNLVIDPLLRLNTTINSSGTITSKTGDMITNKLKCGNYLTFHVWGASWAGIYFYTASDTFISRIELNNTTMTSHGNEVQGSVKSPANTAYARICIVTDGTGSNIVAFDGICDASGHPVYKRKCDYAFIETAAHRGWTVNTPENTIISTKQAKLHGFTAVENDVRYTSDGVAVLLHDESINRTARNSDGTSISSTVNIANITYDEALAYDFGVYAGEEYAGTKICTFEEQLAFCKKAGLSLWVDIKVSGHASDVVNLVKKYGMQDHVVYTAFSAETLSSIVSIVPNATVMLAASSLTEERIELINDLKTETNEVYASLDYTNLTSENISDLQTNGISLALYTVDNYNKMLNITPYCTKIISTYYPAEIAIEHDVMF